MATNTIIEDEAGSEAFKSPGGALIPESNSNCEQEKDFPFPGSMASRLKK